MTHNSYDIVYHIRKRQGDKNLGVFILQIGSRGDEVNKERYNDPTADLAVGNVMREHKKQMHSREKVYKQSRNYENINKMLFSGSGKYQIPQIEPTQYEGCEFIGFNYAKSAKNRENKGIHFFLDDYQFIRLWNSIDKYLPLLQQFRYVMTPDFSMYTDFPKALQIYNHYRKHWIGAYMQENGVRVIPTIGWSTEDSFEWCFDGEPVGGCVAVSAIGTRNHKESRDKFLNGYNRMLEVLKPEQILFYGKIPDVCRNDKVTQISAFQERFVGI